MTGQCVRLSYPNAKSGTFEVHRHGESSALTVFSDPECTKPLTSLAIDANGLAKFYTTDYVDVVVMDSSGATVDTFTDGVRAEAVRVASSSFTGTDGDGAQSLGGVIGLKALLDKWKDSAGAGDFNTRRTAATADETIKEALDAIASANQPYFDVKEYGAKGDGVTDDYPAFVAAYDAAVAAGGGIIFVPGSENTYVLSSSFSITSALVSLKGAGMDASVLELTASIGAAISVNLSSTDLVGSFVEDIGITNVAGATSLAIEIRNAPGFRVIRLGFDMASASPAQSNVFTPTIFSGCRITLPAGIFFQTGSDGSVVHDCRGYQAATVTGNFLTISVADVLVSACVFQSDRTAAAITCISLGSASARTRILGCHFIFPAAPTESIGIIAQADVAFHEEGNTINRTPSTTIAVFRYAAAVTTTNQPAHRGSRLRATNSSPGATYTPNAGYETHIIEVSADVTIAAPASDTVDAPASGGRLVFIIHNSSAGNIDVTWNAAYNVSATPTTVAAGARARVELIRDGTISLAANARYRALAAVGNF